MKDLLKITLNLTVLFFAAGAILAVVYVRTEPTIVLTKKLEKEKALKALIPDASVINTAGSYEPLEGREAEYYVAKGRGGEPLGYIAASYSKGYSSIISLLVAVDHSMRIKGITILEQQETPGLGDGIGDKKFQDQFSGKTLDELVVVKNPDPTKIEAITGATISSRAVTKGVRGAVKFMMEKYGVSVAEKTSKE